MIHYHGTPIGGKVDNRAGFFHRRHAMVSFAHPEDIGIVAEACQSFVLDNGAFSTWKTGKPLDIEGYAEWVDTWKKHPGFDWHLAPDVIDGNEDDNDKMLNRWVTRCEVVDARPVPVFHFHESFDRLRYLCEAYSRVALGSSGQWPMPGTDSWWERLQEIMEAIVDDRGRPNCKLHGLRMLSPAIFARIPLASADSTNAAINSRSCSRSRFGMYPPLQTWQRAAVIADRIESHNSASSWIDQEIVKQDLFDLVIN